MKKICVLELKYDANWFLNKLLESTRFIWCCGFSDWANDIKCSAEAEHETRAVRLHYAQDLAWCCIWRDPRGTC